MKRRLLILALGLVLVTGLVFAQSRTTGGGLYTSGTITENGDSGWRQFHRGFSAASFTIDPADLATDETLDVDIDFAYDGSGGGLEADVVSFAQITSTNANETIHVSDPHPSWYRITWTVAGTTPSMSFVMYSTRVGSR